MLHHFIAKLVTTIKIHPWRLQNAKCRLDKALMELGLIRQELSSFDKEVESTYEEKEEETKFECLEVRYNYHLDKVYECATKI